MFDFGGIRNRKVVQRINALLKDIQRTPFEGVGKPEPLKHALSGYWSRHITDEHRIVYKVEGDAADSDTKCNTPRARG